MKKMRIVIFASGEGTNAQRIIDHFKNSALAEVTLIISGNPNANVLNRAASAGIPSLVISKADFAGSLLPQQLKKMSTDLIVLAGFLWMIPETLIHEFSGRIINIHPALLPDFGGKGMYGMNVHKAVIAAGAKESGITIHAVNEHYDEGEIIEQHRCPVLPGDTPETLAERIHQLEHIWFPHAIEKQLRLLNTKQN